MMLNIIVLIKQVPKIHNPKLDKATGTIVRVGIENKINPDDLYGLELALKIKETYDGNVTAITMGPPQASSALRECLAMGIDNAILLSDPKFSYSDTFQTTLILKEALNKIQKYDIIITGSETSDSSTGYVPFQLSEALDIPLITDIYSFELDNRKFKCQRNFGHESQNIEVPLPVIIRVRKHFNKPRYVSLLGIKKAYEKEIKIMDYNSFNCPDHIDGINKSPAKVIKTEDYDIKRKNQVIEGNINQKVKKIIEILQKHGIERIWTGEKNQVEL